MKKWYIEAGKLPEVVVSTRIRFARNLQEYPFPIRLDAKGKQEVNSIVREVLSNEQSPLAGKFTYYDMAKLDDVAALALVEKHLVSPEFVNGREGRGLLISKDESVSIMLCEEDHIRLQVMKSGFSLEDAFTFANNLDSFLDSRLKFAYDDRLGYLTQCPTNLGTGMRASVMLHLPALEEFGQIPSLANTVSRLGLALRGTYGEGTNAAGAFYQLSNQVTLGISEEAALKNLKSIARQVIDREMTARLNILKKTDLEDKIWRSLGILSYARRLSTNEFMKLISNIRLGKALKVIDIGYDVINGLMLDAQPATLTSHAKKNLTESERDTLRATLVRERIYKGVEAMREKDSQA